MPLGPDLACCPAPFSQSGSPGQSDIPRLPWPGVEGWLSDQSNTELVCRAGNGRGCGVLTGLPAETPYRCCSVALLIL